MALAKLIDEKFGVKTRAIVNPVVASVGTTAVEILRNNPDRLGFVAINLSINEVYIAPVRDVSATRGIRLNANGGLLTMFYGEDFELVGYAFFALASGVGSTIFVMEIEAE